MSISTIPKKIIIFASIGVIIWFIGAVVAGTQPLGLLVMGLALSGWTFLLPAFLFLVAPLLVAFTNKLYPSKRLSALNAILQLLFMASYAALGLVYLFAKEALLYSFWLTVGLFAIIILKAAIRLVYKFIKAPSPSKVRFLLIFSITIVLVASPFIVFELNSREEFEQVSKATQEIETKLRPLGAVEHFDKERLPSYRKEGVINRADCNYVHPCPSVQREWYVLMDISKYKRGEFIRSSLEDLGYEINTFPFANMQTIGYKDFKNKKMHLELTLNPLGELQPPYAAPAGKTWWFLMARSDLVTYGGGSYLQEESEPSKAYQAQNEELSFDYPPDWLVQESSSRDTKTIVVKSPNGEPGIQRSGEPKATTGEVIKIVITPCPGGRECTIDGVYDGIYKHRIGSPTTMTLDDGTQATRFLFQYRGEEATKYTVFFRDSKKYVVTYNSAGADYSVFSQHSISDIFYPFIEKMRFFK